MASGENERHGDLPAKDVNRVLTIAGVVRMSRRSLKGVDPILVSGDGSMSTTIYPGSCLKGGFTILELPTREDAIEWARKIAISCRCSQELREFMYDPARLRYVTPSS